MYERNREALDTDLSAWRAAYPDVDVRTVLADDDPAAFLGALAARAELLVIGGSARFARLARLAPSASSIIAASAGCPVLVVPARVAAPPRAGITGRGRPAPRAAVLNCELASSLTPAP